MTVSSCEFSAIEVVDENGLDSLSHFMPFGARSWAGMKHSHNLLRRTAPTCIAAELFARSTPNPHLSCRILVSPAPD